MALTLSVIIPTYNRATLVKRALDSVLRQTRPADEVMVVDDGCTDDTATEIRRHYPNVRLLQQPQRGVSAARNLGIRHASSDWLAFLDCDDEWLPEKLEAQIAAIDRPSPSYLVHSDEIWIRNGRRVNPRLRHQKHGGEVFAHCLPLCCISPSSAIVHKGVFEQIGLFDEALPACEDYDMWLRICARYSVRLVDKPLIIKYGGHGDQLSRRYWGMDRFRIRALEKLLSSDGLTPTQRRAAVDMLGQKIAIYLNGARRRQKQDEVAFYQSVHARYCANNLTPS